MRFSDLRFGAWLLYIFVVGAGARLGGLAGWASFLLGGTVYPLLDALPFGPIGREDRSDSRRSIMLLLTYAAAQTAVVGWVLLLIATRSYSAGALVGIALSLGTLTGGIGIPAAHELIHSPNPRLRAVGLYLLAFALYMHFRIEHIHGHHRAVATPDDPATARRGEGLWRFIARSVPQQLASAYRIEERLRRNRNGDPKRPNRVLFYLAIQAGLLLTVGLMFGGTAVLVMLGQAATAIMFLEATNYIEHYGLERRPLRGGYEPVAPHHSWNTTSFLTNSLAFNLGLHADHHAHPQRSFLTLRHCDQAPQLPAGYLAMLSVAALPPLWRRVMHPRLDAFQSRACAKPATSGDLATLIPTKEKSHVLAT